MLTFIYFCLERYDEEFEMEDEIEYDNLDVNHNANLSRDLVVRYILILLFFMMMMMMMMS